MPGGGGDTRRGGRGGHLSDPWVGGGGPRCSIVWSRDPGDGSATCPEPQSHSATLLVGGAVRDGGGGSPRWRRETRLFSCLISFKNNLRVSTSHSNFLSEDKICNPGIHMTDLSDCCPTEQALPEHSCKWKPFQKLHGTFGPRRTNSAQRRKIS